MPGTKFKIVCCVWLFFSQVFVQATDSNGLEMSELRPPQCNHGPIQQNVTLRHHIESGRFVRLGPDVEDMETCIQLCCKREDCELAFMPGTHCYGVDCYSERHCEITGVKPVNLTVQLATVRPITHGLIDSSVRYSSIKHNEKPLLRKQTQKKELHCIQSPIIKNVTLRGGAKSGDLLELGTVDTMHVCTALCCDRPRCDLAMLIDTTCIGVACYSEELCQPIAARPTHNNPQLSFIRRRVLRSAAESRKANLLPAVPKEVSTLKSHHIVNERLPHPTILKISACSTDKIHHNATIVGGIKAGNFTELGSVRNMQECIGKSCELDRGDIAFMLGNICYSLTCASDRVCETIPAKPYALHTKLAFLRWAPKINETENLLDEREYLKLHRHIPKCTRSHILYNHTLQGGLRAGNFTKLAEVDSIETCAALCCAESSCDLALVLGENCYAGDCASKDLCVPVPTDPAAAHPSQIAYITSRYIAGERKPDWSLWYIVVGSIAISVGFTGIVWTFCTCWQRSRVLRPKEQETHRFTMMDANGRSIQNIHMLPQGKYIHNGPLFLSDTESDTEEEPDIFTWDNQISAKDLHQHGQTNYSFSLPGGASKHSKPSYEVPLPPYPNRSPTNMSNKDSHRMRRAMQNL